jgi:hypothetical protein
MLFLASKVLKKTVNMSKLVFDGLENESNIINTI